MIEFSSIATDIQILIAEKIDYFDQKEFSLSSKHGKEIVRRTKHKAVVVVEQMQYLMSIRLFIKTPQLRNEDSYYVDWDRLREAPDLPRYAVELLIIHADYSFRDLHDMNIRAGFVKNRMQLQPYHGSRIPAKKFSELANIFNFGSFRTISTQDPALFRLPEFQEIDNICISAENLLSEDLLQLKARKITLCSSVSISILNLFLQQWFQNTREIERLGTPLNFQSDQSDHRDVFRGLPFKEMDAVQRNTTYATENLYRYLIERADQKLLVTVTVWTIAQEQVGRLDAREFTADDDIQ